MKAKRALIIISSIAAIAIAIILYSEISVSSSAKNRLYNNLNDLPHRKVGLILGTSPISTWTGKRNLHFDNRITAGALLFNTGKVDYLIVSGGDYRKTENGYDEPATMRDSLIKHGVDSTRIWLDYDGTRTLKSIANVRNTFHQDSIIIISQQYHNERALYQAKHLGIDAIAYNALTPTNNGSWLRNRTRETLARVKLQYDLLFINQQ